jgi:hypothetical protein
MRPALRATAAGAAVGILTLAFCLSAPAAGSTKLAELKPAEIQALPDATVVTVGTRSVSLGVLRAEHQARLARFAHAAALGSAQRAMPSIARAGASLGSARSGSPPSGSPTAGTPRPTPSPSPPIATLVPPVKNQLMPTGAANDYRDFCRETGATTCLYLPASAPGSYTWVNGSAIFQDVDPLIVDPSVCAALGGAENTIPGISGCVLSYPTQFLGNFVPGPVTAGPPTFIQACPYPVHIQTDPHGAIKLDLAGLTPTSSANLVCTVSAYVTP